EAPGGWRRAYCRYSCFALSDRSHLQPTSPGVRWLDGAIVRFTAGPFETRHHTITPSTTTRLYLLHQHHLPGVDYLSIYFQLVHVDTTRNRSGIPVDAVATGLLDAVRERGDTLTQGV